MERIILHNELKVNEINRKKMDVTMLMYFTDTLLNSGMSNRQTVDLLKQKGFQHSASIETNIINLDTLIKIVRCRLISRPEGHRQVGAHQTHHYRRVLQ